MGSNAVNVAQAAVQKAASLAAQIYYAYGYTQNNQTAAGSSGPWRPPQWTAKSEPLFSILPTYQGVVGPQQLYVFDGPMEIDEEQQSVITLNPIQTGAPIADHAYMIPARVVAHLLMSDSMQSFTVAQFADGASRSVSAWQVLKSLQAAKTLLTVSTRLDQYDNMLITSRSAVEDKETRFAGKFTVTFTQILTASVEATQSTLNVDPLTDTTDPQTVVETQVGQAQIQPVPANLSQAYTVESGITSAVPAAGAFSSTPYFSGKFPF